MTPRGSRGGRFVPQLGQISPTSFLFSSTPGAPQFAQARVTDASRVCFINERISPGGVSGSDVVKYFHNLFTIIFIPHIFGVTESIPSISRLEVFDTDTSIE